MTFIAQQRIKTGGKHYRFGDQVPLSTSDLAELPDGAVLEQPDEQASPDTDLASPTDQDDGGLSDAVAELGADAFKQDGAPRIDTLRTLSEQVGRDVSEAEVMAALAALNEGQSDTPDAS